ncbi:hypothetical protein [Taibaiella helva]|uniref:hypothetical protein n=1 Tax=Taibaiella helva TaxID=2301235 RepID=UPI000E5733C3|nr:hypothetical protein [Taibaiella helva]
MPTNGSAGRYQYYLLFEGIHTPEPMPHIDLDADTTICLDAAPLILTDAEIHRQCNPGAIKTLLIHCVFRPASSTPAICFP